MPIRLQPDFGKNGYFQQHRFVAIFDKIDGADWLEKNLLEVKLPSLSFTASEFWDGVVRNRLVSSGEFGTLGLSFYCSLEQKMDPVYKWIRAHLEHSSNVFGAPENTMTVKFKNAGGVATPGYKRDIFIKLLAPDGSDINTWYFYGCQLSSVNFDQLSYRSDAVLTVSIEVMPDRVVLPTGATMQATPESAPNSQNPVPQQDVTQGMGGQNTANTGFGQDQVTQNVLGAATGVASAAASGQSYSSQISSTFSNALGGFFGGSFP